MKKNNLYDWCLENNKQDLLREWHPEKNIDLSTNNITYGSGIKAWWICKLDHEWQASIVKRINGNNCPFCSNRRITYNNSLKSVNPKLAQEWHPVKNGSLTASDVSPSSNKRIWWKCNVCSGEWQAYINNRNNQNNGCPYCKGKKVNEKNCLATCYPEIAKQWHPTKNDCLTPNDVVCGTHKKVWWICQKGHEWEANINNRIKGRGCPFCNDATQSSLSERIVYFYVNQMLSDAINRYKHQDEYEVDIYSPKYKIAIEYDGYFYHNKEKSARREIIKDSVLFNDGIYIIHIKEQRTEVEKQNDAHNIYCVYKDSKTHIYTVIEELYKILNSIDKSITKPVINLDNDIQKIQILHIKKEIRNSLGVKYPNLVKEWHPTKNQNISPFMVAPHTHKRAWWICENGHEWEAQCDNRAKGSGCPYCSNYYASTETNLLSNYPLIAKEFNPTRNGELKSDKLLPNSNKRIWWLCDKGHEWQASPNKRVSDGNGCPYCSRRKAQKGVNDLCSIYPKIAEEWVFDKNAPLDPTTMLPGSGKVVWWKCKFCGELYPRTVACKVELKKCPCCKENLTLQ